MTVRITVADNGGVRRIVRIEGRLTAAEWGELEQVIANEPASAALDLSGLRSADAVALDGLRRLGAAGGELRNVPHHLAWRIEDATPAAATDPGRR
jgi:hypothetical protein